MPSLTPDPKILSPKSLITVIGPIGSGKTTVSQLLAEKLRLPLLDADLFEANPFLPDYIQDNVRWAFATELFFTLQRLKKLKPLPAMLKKSSLIVDSGLIMSQIYMKNHLLCGTITTAEWQFYQSIVADYQTALPQPNLLIYLKAKPATQLSRIRARGRDFEAGYTLAYLTQITDRLSEYISNLNHLEHHKPANDAKSRSIGTTSLPRRQAGKIQILTVDTDIENLLESSAQQELLAAVKSKLETKNRLFPLII